MINFPLELGYKHTLAHITDIFDIFNAKKRKNVGAKSTQRIYGRLFRTAKDLVRLLRSTIYIFVSQ